MAVDWVKRCGGRLAGIFAGSLLAGSQAFAGDFVITPTFTSNVGTLMGGNATNFKNAFNLSASNFTNLFNDPIHVNITVDAVAGTGTLGASNTPIFSTAFSTLNAALVNDATSGDDFLVTGAGGSVASTLTDPLTATHTYWVTRAQRK